MKRFVTILAAAIALFSLTQSASGVGIVTQSGARCFNCTTGSGGGSLVDGADYSYTSSVTMASPPTVEWLGGKNGVIDSGTAGVHFTRTNWTELGTTTSNWQWNTGQLRNRSKTLYYDGAARGETLGAHGNARGTYQYDTGASGWTSVYVSVNYYWQVNPSYPNLQWKMLRYQQQTDAGGPEVVDGHAPSGYWSNSIDGSTIPFVNFHQDSNDHASFPVPDSGTMPRNQWMRAQFYMRVNTGGNSANFDGLGRLEVTSASGTQARLVDWSNINFRNVSDNTNVFRYLIFQNYFGNGDVSDGGSGVTVPGNNAWGDTILFMDDIYVSPNTRARVEISDGVSEPNIQKIKSASSTARTIELNLGHLDCVGHSCTLREYDDTNTVVTTISISQNVPANDDYFHQDARLAA